MDYIVTMTGGTRQTFPTTMDKKKRKNVPRSKQESSLKSSSCLYKQTALGKDESPSDLKWDRILSGFCFHLTFCLIVNSQVKQFHLPLPLKPFCFQPRSTFSVIFRRLCLTRNMEYWYMEFLHFNSELLCNVFCKSICNILKWILIFHQIMMFPNHKYRNAQCWSTSDIYSFYDFIVLQPGTEIDLKVPLWHRVD